MKFSDVVDSAKALLQRKGRITYRALAREFGLDDEALRDLADELISADRVAADEDGKVLVWVGAAAGPLAAAVMPAGGDVAVGPAGALVEPLPEGDRRQLTVMFCDLVGSTALSERLDPEDLHQLVKAYQQAVQQVMLRYEGHIAQFLGDGILAYFGYPVAHEDDAARAVRAGLDMLAAIAALDVTPPVQVRVGLHTGLAVIGAVGEAGRIEQLALGRTPNIAARVQAAAEPHSLYISGATQRLVQGLFDTQDLGQHQLKGIAEPMSLYRVAATVLAAPRFDDVLRHDLKPLQGRTAELDDMARCWQLARAGRGGLLLLTGEAGIGKSRLLQSLGRVVADDGALELAFRCSPYYVNSAFYPLIDQLGRMVLGPAEDGHATRLARLERFLLQVGMPERRQLALFGQLLSLNLPDELAAVTPSREDRKPLTLNALVDLLARLASRQPVFVVVEDLHWADPSTLDLLSLVAERLPRLALLLTVTARPPFEPPWPAGEACTRLALGRLAPADIACLAADVAGQAVPPEVLELLIGKTDGVPLYVREFTRELLDSGLLALRNGQLQVTGPLPSVAVPFSLQDSLTSRLDRLGPARRLAEVAAVIGREFSQSWLQAVFDGDADALAPALQALCDADILLRKGEGQETHYIFRHALLRDAAYNSLLKRRRQQIHARVAGELAARWPEITLLHPELVAHHHTEAGQTGPAVSYWQRAAQQAVERSANREAIRHFGTALELLRGLPHDQARDRQELALQMGLGVPLSVTTSWAAPEVRAAHERALALCVSLGETDQLFRALYGVWSNCQVQGDFRAAQPLSEQLLALADQAPDDGLRLQAHRAAGIHALHTGQFGEALRHCDAGLAIYDPQRHRVQVAQYWLDPGVGCLCYGAWAQVCMGYPDQALARVHRALVLAIEGGHDFSIAYATHFVAVMHERRREPALLRRHAQTLLDLARDKGFPAFQAWSTLLLGCALAEEGRAAEGSTLIRQAQQVAQTTGSRVARSASLCVLAGVYVRAHETELGLATVAEALAFVQQSDERFYEAELLRTRGLLLEQLADGHADPAAEADAIACYEQAITLARQQQARTWELRAATALARLHLRRNRPQRARDTLSGLLDTCSEGWQTPDVVDARALLDALTASPA